MGPDPYRKKAHLEGYASRAAYKLIAIDNRYNVLAKRRGIVELGAYPGGWSQVIRRRAHQARLIACDRVKLPRLDPHIICVWGDFQRKEIRDQITNLMRPIPTDLVLSDMAPSISGDRLRDQANIRSLAEHVLNYACLVLTSPRGALVVKFFQGEAMDPFVTQMRRHFRAVKLFKPDASKKRSSEMYVIGADYVLK